jgi:SAM-dependent methyltransferase
MMTIEYDHSRSPHSVAGAAPALQALLGADYPHSILDVGCGIGTWLRAALDLGIEDLRGIDGIELGPDKLLIPSRMFSVMDLTKNVSLQRRFDLVICVEVAEHFDETFAENLISTLVNHGDRIFFSAACPGQPGQNHMNCQWPNYWQGLFNRQKFRCDDSLRWKIWNDVRVDPWYRQNIFLAVRDPNDAGNEPRIPPVIHPDMLRVMNGLGNRLPPNLARFVRRARDGIGLYLFSRK